MTQQILHRRSSLLYDRPLPTRLGIGEIAINYNANDPGLYFADDTAAPNTQLIKIGPTFIGATAPNYTPTGYTLLSKGEAWLDLSSTQILKFYDGSAWVTSRAVASISAGKPNNPVDGQLHYDTVVLAFFIYNANTTSWTQITSGGGGGSGTVTSVATGTGLTGGPITTTGTISLANTAVTPGSYGSASSVATFTVDAQGRLTLAGSTAIAISSSAVSGLAASATTDTTNANNISSGTLGASRLPATTVTPGSYTYASLTVDSTGRLTAASNGTALVSSVSGTAPISSTGGATPTISLDNTAVTPGSYTYTSLTVDSKGRLTAASSGTAPVTSVSATGPITSSGGTTPTISTSMTTGRLLGRTTAGTGAAEEISAAARLSLSAGSLDLATTAVSAGSYTNANITVDAYGRLTAASNGTAFVSSVSGTAPISSTGGATPTISLDNTAVTPGSYTYTSLTVDSKGRLTAASSGTAPVTSVSATGPITSSGGTTPTISTSMTTGRLLGRTTAGTGAAEEISAAARLSLSAGSLDLATTAVSAGSYTNANITVDAYGRLTAASNGSSGSTGTVTSVATGTGLTGGPITTTGTISLADTAVTPGSYTSANITVDAQGRLTAASNGSGGGTTNLGLVVATVYNLLMP